LGVSVQNFTQLGGCADFLRPFIWSHVCGLAQFRNESDKGTASVHQIFGDDATFLSRVITGEFLTKDNMTAVLHSPY
jgi:hypothetical protein